MTPAEENFVHLDECIRNLNEAWYILQEIRAVTKGTAIHAAAFRYALIAYARPYTSSDGEHQKGRKAYKLSLPKLSTEEQKLHNQIIDLRHKVLAHSELIVKQAKVYAGRYGGRAKAIIVSNGLPQFPEIDAVISLIEHTLDSLYVERTRREEALAPTT
jgi:hypothetical protein